MTLSQTPKLALAALISAVALAPAAVAAGGHQTPASHGTKHVTRGALMTGAWTPMVDESRLGAPFTRPIAEVEATLTWLHNRP